MSIGYACLTIGLKNTDFKSCILRNATYEKLTKIIEHNLNSLNNILDYNIKNSIKLFRISSDIIPFASIPENKFNWQDKFSTELKKLGEKAKKNNIRLSMHPGQYTVLNSPSPDVVKRAILDLNYHSEFLDLMGLDSKSKVILHIGGAYKNKEESMQRFLKNFSLLEDSVKSRIVLENDDKIYNISEVLELGKSLNTPVVYDNLHNLINPSDPSKNDAYWINECRKTWKETDGKQKIHYSQQDPDKRAGSHSATIKISEFLDFYNSIDAEKVDIMLEVKDKNLSAVKCINSTAENYAIKNLESEWSRYKYSVLEKSPQNYQKIRILLKDKQNYPAQEFYKFIEDALSSKFENGKVLNGILHVWGYFKKLATDKEKANFLLLIEKYNHNDAFTSIQKIKKYLFKLSEKYNQTYLINSYYFYI